MSESTGAMMTTEANDSSIPQSLIRKSILGKVPYTKSLSLLYVSSSVA